MVHTSLKLTDNINVRSGTHTHALTHSLTHSLTHLLTHSLTHSTTTVSLHHCITMPLYNYVTVQIHVQHHTPHITVTLTHSLTYSLNHHYSTTSTLLPHSLTHSRRRPQLITAVVVVAVPSRVTLQVALVLTLRHVEHSSLTHTCHYSCATVVHSSLVE